MEERFDDRIKSTLINKFAKKLNADVEKFHLNELDGETFVYIVEMKNGKKYFFRFYFQDETDPFMPTNEQVMARFCYLADAGIGLPLHICQMEWPDELKISFGLLCVITNYYQYTACDIKDEKERETKIQNIHRHLESMNLRSRGQLLYSDYAYDIESGRIFLKEPWKLAFIYE